MGQILKLLIGMLLLMAEPLSAQSEWNITTEKYAGNEYIIKKIRDYLYGNK